MKKIILLIMTTVCLHAAYYSTGIKSRGTASNVDLVFQPKGQGQVSLLPQGTTNWTYTSGSFSAGSLLLSNGTSDAPQLKWLTANNTNCAIDADSSGFRFLTNADESGATVRMTLSRSGDLSVSNMDNTVIGAITPNAAFFTTVKIGGGTQMSAVYSASATLDFPSISAAGTQDLTITVTGAAVGDVVSLALPASPDVGVVFNAWVSATNTVTIRATNVTGGSIDPASASYRAAVIHF